jgi:hypothetical protein
MEAPIIHSAESLREVIAVDFKKDLPLRGGWGYSMDDAIIIDRNDPTVPQGIPFDGIGIEYFVVEKRIYEELIIFRSDGDKFNGIKWNLLKQSLVQHAGKTFDHLRFEVTGLHDRDWNELKETWEGPDGFVSENFDRSKHFAEQERRTARYEADYWFEISSFF